MAHVDELDLAIAAADTARRDGIALREPFHVRPDGLDDADGLGAQIHRQGRIRGVATGGDVHVGRVDAGVAVADAELPRPRLGHGLFDQFGGLAEVRGERRGDELAVGLRHGRRVRRWG